MHSIIVVAIVIGCTATNVGYFVNFIAFSVTTPYVITLFGIHLEYVAVQSFTVRFVTTSSTLTLHLTLLMPTP